MGRGGPSRCATPGRESWRGQEWISVGSLGSADERPVSGVIRWISGGARSGATAARACRTSNKKRPSLRNVTWRAPQREEECRSTAHLSSLSSFSVLAPLAASGASPAFLLLLFALPFPAPSPRSPTSLGDLLLLLPPPPSPPPPPRPAPPRPFPDVVSLRPVIHVEATGAVEMPPWTACPGWVRAPEALSAPPDGQPQARLRSSPGLE